MKVGVKIFKERSSSVTVFEALQLMIAFAGFIISLLLLVVAIINTKNKK